MREDKKRTQQNKEKTEKPELQENVSQKKQRLEKIITVVVVFVAVVLAGFGLWKLSGEDEKPSNQLVFTVGTEEVYLDEVNFCIIQNLAALGITAEELQTSTAQDGTGAAEHYKQEILDLIMDYKVTYMMAKKQGLSLTTEEVQTVQKDVSKYLGQVDARVLNQWGVSQDLLVEVFSQRYLANKLEENVKEEVEIEEQKYCTIYMLLFPKIEMAEDGNYVTEADGETPIMLSDEEIARRKEDAESALQELKEGADIENVAQTYHVADYSAQESNTVESFGEPFSQYAESLQKGECSPVLETESCYAIVQMVEENNEELAEQIMTYYRADVEKEVLEEKRVSWYEEMGVGDTPKFHGKTWERISLYDYVR